MRSRLLYAALGFLLVPLAHAIGVASLFSDVPAGYQHATAINYAASAGIVSGNPDGTFRPDDTINRAAFTKMIVGAAHIDEASCSAQFFRDVPADAWFAPYVQAARCAGIVNGYPDGTFRPSQNVTFVEAAKMIILAFHVTVSDGSVWYEGFVQQLSDQHAIPTDIIRLEQPVTRGQVAEMLYRVRADVRTEPTSTLSSLTSGSAVSGGSTPSTPGVPADLSRLLGRFTNDLRVFDPGFADEFNRLASGEPRPLKNFDVYTYKNYSLYVQRENGDIRRAILLAKGDTIPDFARGFWKQMNGSTLRNLIATSVAPTYEIEDVDASKFPDDLAEVLRVSYGGSLDLASGQHMMAELDLKGVVKDVLEFLNYPTTNLIAKAGRDVPSLTWQTGASAGIEATKKDGKPSDALEPTYYIQITRTGDWQRPLGMEKTTLTDATVYLDDGPVFGFWGVGTFDGDRFGMFYKGPLVRSKDPRDYAEAMAGFGAGTMSLQKYLKLMTAYGTRIPGGSAGSFMEPIDAPAKATVDFTFDALSAMPLEILTVTNDDMRDLVFQAGDDFPEPDAFNAVLLGPLAEAPDGTSGPLATLRGTARLFNAPFGTIDMKVGTSGAKAIGKGTLALPLGSVEGLDLGSLGPNASIDLNVSRDDQHLRFLGRFDAGPFGGQDVSIDVRPTNLIYRMSATCVFPLDITMTAGMSDPGSVNLSSLNFTPLLVLPDPSKLTSCPEDIFYAVQAGTVYVFTKGKVLVQAGVDKLPIGDIAKIGNEGLKLAGGALSAGKQALLDAAKTIPILNKLPVQCGFEQVENATKCGVQAVTDGAKCGFEVITDAGRCGVDAVADAAKCGTQYVVSGAQCGYDWVTDAAKCGTEVVSDGAKCGYDWVTDAARCGRSSYSCALTPWKWGTCWKALSCYVPKSCSVGKSCNVPKGCNVPNTCNVPKSCNDLSKPKTCTVPKSCEDLTKPVFCK